MRTGIDQDPGASCQGREWWSSFSCGCRAPESIQTAGGGRPPENLCLWSRLPGYETHQQSRGFSNCLLHSLTFWRMESLVYTLIFKLCESHSFLFMCDLRISGFPDPTSQLFRHWVWRRQWTRTGQWTSGLWVRMCIPLSQYDLKTVKMKR